MTFMHLRNQDDFLAALARPFLAAHPAGVQSPAFWLVMIPTFSNTSRK